MERKREKLWMGCLFAITSCVFLTACTSNSPKTSEKTGDNESVTLTIYAQYADEDTMYPYDYAVEKLKEAYPNVTLKLDIQAQDDGQKLQTYAITGNLPDIYQAGKQQIEAFKESGNIMRLNEVAKEVGFDQKITKDANDILYDEDGNIYAFPYAGNEVVLWYYNKDLFQKYGLEVPKTFDELCHVIDVFKEHGIIPMALFGKEKWVTTALYDILATRFEPGGIKELDAGTVLELGEGYQEAANVLQQLASRGMFPSNVTSLNYDQAVELFYSGGAAMMINGQWEMGSAYEKMKDSVDWMYYPSYSEEAYEAGKKVFSGGGTIGGYAVNPNSRHRELAAKVAAFISEKYCEAKYLYRSNPFVTIQIEEEPKTPFNEMTKRLLSATKEAQYTRFTWGLSNARFKTEIEDKTQLLLTSQYRKEEFCDEMNSLLQKMKEE
ncbi:MAG: raffinose/stachyose/melibiose transport system substrate-binding protein [Clostridiales bacterium]|nr:raffinose/stachyose/melibiose transport system substrate-binding protein [Clostridiales bacterium]